MFVAFLKESNKLLAKICKVLAIMPGDNGGGVIPVPIPNTEVKPSNVNGTAPLRRGRVENRQAFFCSQESSEKMDNVNGINMVQKTIDVLSYLANNPKGAKLSKIAEELGYAKTTVHDILKTLLNNNFIQYVHPEKKIYIIGARVYTMGITYLESSSLLRIAKPYLTLLADKYEKTTFIAKRSNDRAFCIYKYASLHAKAPTGTIGDQKLLHSTSIGKCYLAFDADAAPLIETIELPSFTPYTITSREKLKANVREIRQLGYSWEQRESHELMACLAAPLYNNNSMVGAISMTGWYKEDEDFAAQGSEIAQLANIISQQLDESDHQNSSYMRN